jgi:hypothetical protein
MVACSVGRGIAPAHVSDEELARYPVIVVGRWNKAPLRPHIRLEPHPGKGEVCTASETHTELVVERVIRGNISPGTHRILLGYRIGWLRPDGGKVIAYWSSEQWGDVEEVGESNLWFLVPERSWDESDSHTYLMLETCRGVQPLEREGYFRALVKDYDESEARHRCSAWLWSAAAGVVILLGALLARRSWRRKAPSGPDSSIRPGR